jgi:hypothetical protein
MKLLAQEDEQLDVRMQLYEVIFMSNMLHEICHGFTFSDQEFQDIFDATRADAEMLLRRMEAMLDRLGVTPAEA